MPVFTQKDLKKMSRKDLLQIMVLQSKKIDKLESKLKTANELLETKRIMLDNVGSIAEASLKLNKVFEAAQHAADQYLENIKILAAEQQEQINNSKLEKSSDKKKINTTKKKKSSKKLKNKKES